MHTCNDTTTPDGSALEVLRGQAYLDALVAHLQCTLDVAYAFVAQRVRGHPETARTLAVADRGGPVGQLVYPLAGTPCDDTLAGGVCTVPAGARARYPADVALQHMAVEGYVGTLLVHAGGEVCGWLGVMHTAPIEDPDAVVARLRRFARRAALELERVNVDEALQASQAKFATAFRCSQDAMVISCMESGEVLEVNDAFLEMTGYSRADVLGCRSLGSGFWVHASEAESLKTGLAAGGTVRNLEIEFRNRAGETRAGLLSAETVRVGERPCVVAVVTDITELKRTGEQLVHSALHDALTGLPNRALFMDRLLHVLERTRRRRDYRFAVLFLDLDRFKVINDSLGHRAGDELLIGIARRLEACLRPGDTVARLGGDECAVLLEDVADAGDALRIAERMLHALRIPFDLDGTEVFTSASIGVALSGNGYEDPQDLLRDADLAMYRAKANGRARCEVFDHAMHDRVIAQLQVETDLRHALDRNQLELAFQPIVNLRSGVLAGMEALVRWRHPDRGVVMPADFIPLAEETGLIIRIGACVLRHACLEAKRWHAALPGQPFLSVNLSPRQFLQPDLVAMVAGVLAETGLNPGSLHLEITESAVMESGPDVQHALEGLRRLGVKLCLDDFGTGYSSLSALHEFPIDTLKIDRSFVSRLGGGGRNAEVIRTIVSLGQHLQQTVIGEGIETAEQAGALEAMGCELGQGHYFARPMTGPEALQYLAGRT